MMVKFLYVKCRVCGQLGWGVKWTLKRVDLDRATILYTSIMLNENNFVLIAKKKAAHFQNSLYTIGSVQFSP